MSNKIILCVEDNIKVQEFNQPLLEAKGFTVKAAMTLYEAREAIKREMPGLIILDIHLPDGNGLDFLREIRETSNIPVIALTNNKQEQDIETGFASGCDDYMTKPYTFPVLYARIEGLLRRVSKVPDVLVKGSLTLNVLAGLAFLNGEDLHLQKKRIFDSAVLGST
jgi:DNA-binding response OmpR family regulator